MPAAQDHAPTPGAGQPQGKEAGAVPTVGPEGPSRSAGGAGITNHHVLGAGVWEAVEQFAGALSQLAEQLHGVANQLRGIAELAKQQQGVAASGAAVGTPQLGDRGAATVEPPKGPGPLAGSAVPTEQPTLSFKDEMLDRYERNDLPKGARRVKFVQERWEFTEANDGGFVVVADPSASGVGWVFPVPGRSLVDDSHSGLMFVFEYPTPGSQPSYSSFKVLEPAKVERSGQAWRLVEKGKLELPVP